MSIQELGTIIRKRRKELGFTQVDLAELAGVNPNTLIRIENAKISPTLQIVNKIVTVLGMEPKIQMKQGSES